MTRTRWVVTVAALTAVLVSAYWWAVGRTAWQPPAPRIPALPEVPKLPEPGRFHAKQALERPLFWASRRPVPKASDKEADKPAVDNELMQSRLMAVVESGGRKVALLQRPDGSALKIGAGEPASPWRLDNFNGTLAIFVNAGGERVERPLERISGPPAAAPSSREAGPKSSARNRRQVGNNPSQATQPPSAGTGPAAEAPPSSQTPRPSAAGATRSLLN